MQCLAFSGAAMLEQLVDWATSNNLYWLLWIENQETLEDLRYGEGVQQGYTSTPIIQCNTATLEYKNK